MLGVLFEGTGFLRGGTEVGRSVDDVGKVGSIMVLVLALNTILGWCGNEKTNIFGKALRREW